MSETTLRALPGRPGTLGAWMPEKQIRSKQNPSDGARHSNFTLSSAAKPEAAIGAGVQRIEPEG